MKTVITAAVMFLAVIVFVWVNFNVLNNFFDETNELLVGLPTTVEEVEGMDQAQLAGVNERLEKIHMGWKERETYISLSLEHSVSREFLNAFLPAVAYFNTRSYPEFLAQIKLARDTLEHLIFDESLKLGNIL